MVMVMGLCGLVVAFQWTANAFTTVPFVLLIAIFDVPVVAFSILATTAHSGGHLNPAITFATMCAGLTSLFRGVCYMIAQLVGGIAGAAIIWGVESRTQKNAFGAGNCLSGFWTKNQQLLGEFAFTFLFLFVVFSLSFESAQRHVHNRASIPWIIGGAFGLAVLFSGLIGNHDGVWMHPARCFGAAVVSGDFAHVGIAFAGPALAAALIGLYYHTMRVTRPANYHEYPDRLALQQYNNAAMPVIDARGASSSTYVDNKPPIGVIIDRPTAISSVPLSSLPAATYTPATSNV